MIQSNYQAYSYRQPVAFPSYGAPVGPARAGYTQPGAAQFMFLLQGMMTALQQLSVGWQGLMAPNVAPLNQYQAFGRQTGYGPVTPNPAPFSLLPAGQGSAVAPTSYVSAPPVSYGPVSPNPNPYSLLPAGQGSV